MTDVFACMVARGGEFREMATVTRPMAEAAIGMPVHLLAFDESDAAPFESKAFADKLELFETAERLGFDPDFVLLVDADLMLTGWDWGAFQIDAKWFAVPDPKFHTIKECDCVKGPLPGGLTFNTGLFLAHKSMRPTMRRARELMDTTYWPASMNKRCLFGDQGPLNRAMLEHQTRWAALPNKFNTCVWPGERVSQSADVLGWHIISGSPEDKLSRVRAAYKDLGREIL